MLKTSLLLLVLLAGFHIQSSELISFGDRLEKIILQPKEQGAMHRRKTSDGVDILHVSRSAAQDKGSLSVITQGIRLPEFESAVFLLRVLVPEKCAAGEIVFSINGYGKKPIVLRSRVKAAGNGEWQTLRFECKTPVDYPAGISQFRISFDGRNGNVQSLGLGKLEIQVGGLLHSLLTGSSVNVLDLSRRKAAGLLFENRTSSPRKFTLEYRISDSFGKKHDSGKTTLEIPAGKTHRVMFRENAVSGVYHVDYRIVENGQARAYRRRYAAMVPAGMTEEPWAKGFIFSICSHSLRYRFPEIEKEIELMALCGAKHTRNGFSWPDIQPRKGVFNWDRADHFLNLLRKKNLELQTAFIWAPSWAVAEKDRNSRRKGLPCPDFTAYREYVSALVRRFKGRIRFYEVWNEPDIADFRTSFDDYTQLQKIVYEEVKKIDPNAFVMAGGFGNINSLPLQEYVFTHAPDTCDIIAYHEHGPFAHYTGPINRVLKFWKKMGVRQPWFANETAVSSISVGENGQAETLFKKLIYSWAKGSVGYTWYNLRNKGFNPKSSEHNFGMVTADFYPKPVYVAYNALAACYRGAAFLSEETFRNDVYAFRFRKSGRTLYSIWNELNGQDRQLLVFRTNAERAEHIDLFGNTSPLKLYRNGMDHLLIAEAGNQPGTVRLDGVDAKMEYAGSLVSAAGKISIEPGKKRKAGFRVWNPFPSPQEVVLRLRLPEGMTASKTERTLSLAPGENAFAEFELAAEPSFISSLQDRKSLDVFIRFEQAAVSGRIRFPLQPAIRLSAQSDQWQRMGLANNRQQVTSLVAAMPSNEKLFWQGPGDLSVIVSARVIRKRNLQFIVAVIDDIHNQPYRGYDMFRGDGLQLMIQFPGQNSMWEIGVSVHNDGTDEMCIWNAPSQFEKERVLPRLGSSHRRDKRKGVLFYTITLPLNELGTSTEELKQGFAFNIMANDNDGPCRESYISLVPGDPKNADNFLNVVLE